MKYSRMNPKCVLGRWWVLHGTCWECCEESSPIVETCWDGHRIGTRFCILCSNSLWSRINCWLLGTCQREWGNAFLMGKNVFMALFFPPFFTQEPGDYFCRRGAVVQTAAANTQAQEASVSNTAHKMEADSIKAKQYFGLGLFLCPIRLQWVFDLPLPPPSSCMCLRLLCWNTMTPD